MTPELRAYAEALTADWPPLTAEQIALLRRTYGRVQLDQATDAPPPDRPEQLA